MNVYYGLSIKKNYYNNYTKTNKFFLLKNECNSSNKIKYNQVENSFAKLILTKNNTFSFAYNSNGNKT